MQLAEAVLLVKPGQWYRQREGFIRRGGGTSTSRYRNYKQRVQGR